jgi:DNA-binding MarR family transcriptional regulator
VKQLHNIRVDDAPPMLRRIEPTAGDTLEHLFELSTRLTDALDGGLAERGLTRKRAEVLWRLARLGPVTQRRLSVELGCTPRNVTDLVDALEAAGYVSRRSHPIDRRARLVTLTEEGSAAAAEMVDGYGELARDLFAGLGSAEMASFAATLDALLIRLGSSPSGSGTAVPGE